MTGKNKPDMKDWDNPPKQERMLKPLDKDRTGKNKVKEGVLKNIHKIGELEIELIRLKKENEWVKRELKNKCDKVEQLEKENGRLIVLLDKSVFVLDEWKVKVEQLKKEKESWRMNAENCLNNLNQRRNEVEQLEKEKGKFSPHELRILKRVFSEVDNTGWLYTDGEVLYKLKKVFDK